MTKLKLNLAQGAGEILTRDELKRVLGGAGSGGSESNEDGKTCKITCRADYQYKEISISNCSGDCDLGVDYVSCKEETKTFTSCCDGSSLIE